MLHLLQVLSCKCHIHYKSSTTNVTFTTINVTFAETTIQDHIHPTEINSSSLFQNSPDYSHTHKHSVPTNVAFNTSASTNATILAR